MIDREEFAKVMAVFSDKIGRALKPPTFDAYLDTLSESLTTEEFLAGARIVFKTHQFNTWPAPQQFVDAAKPKVPVALEAGEMFEKVLAIACSAYVPRVERLERIKALGPTAERVFRAAGAFREFEGALESQVPFIRNRFVEAYEASTIAAEQKDRAQKALDRGALDPRVQGLVRSTTERLSSGRDRALPAGDQS